MESSPENKFPAGPSRAPASAETVQGEYVYNSIWDNKKKVLSVGDTLPPEKVSLTGSMKDALLTVENIVPVSPGRFILDLVATLPDGTKQKLPGVPSDSPSLNLRFTKRAIGFDRKIKIAKAPAASSGAASAVAPKGASVPVNMSPKKEDAAVAPAPEAAEKENSELESKVADIVAQFKTLNDTREQLFQNTQTPDAPNLSADSQKLEELDDFLDATKNAYAELQDRANKENSFKWFTYSKLSAEAQEMLDYSSPTLIDQDFTTNIGDIMTDPEPDGEPYEGSTMNGFIIRPSPVILEKETFEVIGPDGKHTRFSLLADAEKFASEEAEKYQKAIEKEYVKVMKKFDAWNDSELAKRADELAAELNTFNPEEKAPDSAPVAVVSKVADNAPGVDSNAEAIQALRDQKEAKLSEVEIVKERMRATAIEIARLKKEVEEEKKANEAPVEYIDGNEKYRRSEDWYGLTAQEKIGLVEKMNAEDTEYLEAKKRLLEEEKQKNRFSLLYRLKGFKEGSLGDIIQGDIVRLSNRIQEHHRQATAVLPRIKQFEDASPEEREKIIEAIKKEKAEAKAEHAKYGKQLLGKVSKEERYKLTVKSDEAYSKIEDIQALEEGIEEAENKLWVEEDKKENPFRYFVYDKMSPLARKSFLIEEGRDETRDRLSRIDPSGTAEVDSWTYINKANNYSRLFSSNGFSLCISNPIDLMKNSSSAEWKDEWKDRAKFSILRPDGTVDPAGENLSYEQGEKLLEEKAAEYRDQLVAEYKKIDPAFETSEEKHRKEESERKRLAALKKDKKEHPLRYFVYDKISPEARSFFGIWNDSYQTVEKMEEVGDSQEVQFFVCGELLAGRAYASEFSSNGYGLCVANIEELKDSKGNIRDDWKDHARYNVVNSEWKIEDGGENLSYQDADELFQERAQENQEKMVEEFTTMNAK